MKNTYVSLNKDMKGVFGRVYKIGERMEAINDDNGLKSFKSYDSYMGCLISAAPGEEVYSCIAEGIVKVSHVGKASTLIRSRFLTVNKKVMRGQEKKEFGYNNNGKFNIGTNNLGSCNIGEHNIGSNNVGNRNEGDRHIGSENKGENNVGTLNDGFKNVGDHNIGQYNEGSSNNGSNNTGNLNRGYYNIGERNIGQNNIGNDNQGHHNTGEGNHASCCVGNYNACSYSIGMFNSIPTKGQFMVFNKPLPDGVEQTLIRIGHFKLCADEINVNGSYRQSWDAWDKADYGAEKIMIKELPNYDPEVFLEITGIDWRER